MQNTGSDNQEEKVNDFVNETEKNENEDLGTSQLLMSNVDGKSDEEHSDGSKKIQYEHAGSGRDSFLPPSVHSPEGTHDDSQEVRSPTLIITKLKSPTLSYEERASLNKGKYATPDRSPTKPYSSPEGSKRYDSAKPGSSRLSNRAVKSPTLSDQVSDKETFIPPADNSFDVTSPALSKGTPRSSDKEANDERTGSDRDKRITSPIPLSRQATSPLSYIKLKSPTLSDKSLYRSDLSLYASASEGKGQDIINSSTEADVFYSIENSPGEAQENAERTVSTKPDITESEEPGFSIFEDLVLHGKVTDPPQDFNDIIRDHVSNFGSVSSTPQRSNVNTNNQPIIEAVLSRADAHQHEPPSRATPERIELFAERLSESYDTKPKDSDTLESIPLTKESDDESKPDADTTKGNIPMEAQPILPKRHVLLLLLFLGFAVVYSLRVNINVAIVAMVNNRTRLNKNGRIEIIQAEFDWNSHSQALVVGSFYYGYWILQVPGAWIAMKLGATRIFGYGVLLSSLLSLITPVATRYHILAVIGVRVAQGLVLGVTYPCVIAIWANWAPPLERSTMVTMTMAGSPVGNIIAIPVTGILAKYGFDGGWPSVFYFFGFLGLLWYVVWECVIYDKPENHPNISANERRFIEKSIGEKPFDPLTESLPWIAILTSIPMWGIIFGHFGACWGYYTLFTQMPTYLKDVQHLDIKTMGLVAATPYLLKTLLGPVGGISADMLVKAKYLSVRGVRVLFYAIGCVFAGFFILMTGYYDKKGEAIAFLILGVGFSGLNATGYAVNHLDIAPRYAGILMGITNTFATIPGFLSPMVTGFITKHKRASEWKIVFWITFIVYMVAVILYSIMCAGEKQWWSEGYPVEPPEESAEEEGDEPSDVGGTDKYDEDNKDIIHIDSAKESDVDYEKADPIQERQSSIPSFKSHNSIISPQPNIFGSIPSGKISHSSLESGKCKELQDLMSSPSNAAQSAPNYRQSRSAEASPDCRVPQSAIDSVHSKISCHDADQMSKPSSIRRESYSPPASRNRKESRSPKTSLRGRESRGSVTSQSHETLQNDEGPFTRRDSERSVEIPSHEEPTHYISPTSCRELDNIPTSPNQEEPGNSNTSPNRRESLSYIASPNRKGSQTSMHSISRPKSRGSVTSSNAEALRDSKSSPHVRESPSDIISQKVDTE